MNELDKPLARWTKTKRQRERRQKLLKLKLKSGYFQSFYRNKKTITRQHYEQPYTNQLDNLDEMDKLAEPQNLPRLHNKETERSE